MVSAVILIYLNVGMLLLTTANENVVLEGFEGQSISGLDFLTYTMFILFWLPLMLVVIILKILNIKGSGK